MPATGAPSRRFYEGGAIYWSESTGAHELRGDIFARYSALGAETSPLGLPTTGVIDTADGVGGVTRFQRGSIAGHDGTGTHEVRGAINDKWLALGAEQGLLGFPLTDEQGAADGTGRFNDFQRGAIYWHPETGASEVHGDIEARWKQLGRRDELSRLSRHRRAGLDRSGHPAGRAHQLLPARRHRLARRRCADPRVPDRRVFRSGIGVSSVGGSVELIVTSAGTFHFKGHLHNSGLVGLFCTVGHGDQDARLERRRRHHARGERRRHHLRDRITSRGLGQHRLQCGRPRALGPPARRGGADDDDQGRARPVRSHGRAVALAGRRPLPPSR